MRIGGITITSGDVNFDGKSIESAENVLDTAGIISLSGVVDTKPDKYTHSQIDATDWWSVTHNLGTRDVITSAYAYDITGGTISGALPTSGVIIGDTNNLTISFDTIVSGRIVIIG